MNPYEDTKKAKLQCANYHPSRPKQNWPNGLHKLYDILSRQPKVKDPPDKFSWSLSKSQAETNKCLKEARRAAQVKSSNTFTLNSRLSVSNCKTSLAPYQEPENESVVHKLISRCLSQPHNVLIAKTFQTRRLSLHLGKVHPKLLTNKTQENLALRSKWKSAIQISRYFKGKPIEAANGQSYCQQSVENSVFKCRNNSLLSNTSSQRCNEYKSGYRSNKRLIFNNHLHTKINPSIKRERIKRKNQSLTESIQQLNSKGLEVGRSGDGGRRLCERLNVKEEESVALHPEVKMTRDVFFKMKLSVRDVLFV